MTAYLHHIFSSHSTHRITMIILVYLISVVFHQQTNGQNSPQCNAWSALEQNLKSEDQNIVCNKFDNCSGIKCSGTLNGDEFHGSIQINHCENPVSIDLSADLPELGINAWKRTFHHGESFNLTDFLMCEFSLEKKGENVTIGLDVKLVVTKNKYMLRLLNGPEKISVFHDVVIPVPPCSDSEKEQHSTTQHQNISPSSLKPTSTILPIPEGLSAQGNCTINNSSCGPFEICRQIEKFKLNGICECVADYSRDSRGKCVYNPNVETSSSSLNPTQPSAKVIPSNTSLLLTAILVPITVILLIVGLAYATIKFRVFQYLRRRLRVQVYEHVQLGQEDDDDDDDQLTNPVA